MSNANKASSYSSPATTLRRYWKGYGGCAALLASPYFHAAILLSLPGAFLAPKAWVDKAESIIPSLLGLSLSGYAILLALGSGDFFERIKKSKSNGRPSTLEGISTAFLHFVLVQVISLVASLLYSTLEGVAPLLHTWLNAHGLDTIYKVIRAFVGFIGWLALFYSVMCMVALSFRLYRMIQLVCNLPPATAKGPEQS